MKSIELFPGIKGYFCKCLLSSLRHGQFFMFDKEGDVLCRLIEVRSGRVFFHAISNNDSVAFKDKVEQFNQLVDKTEVYLVKSIPAEYSEGLKNEFMHEMKKRIIDKLTSWEIAFVRMPDVSEIKFENLKGQQKDNAQMMEDMLGFPAANILKHL